MRESKLNAAVIIADEQGYRITNDGNVISPRGTCRKTSPDDNGYLMFTISDGGDTYSVHVHKLAAFQRFGGIIFEEDQEVRHLNNNKLDNSITNISFGTHSENMMDISPSIRMHSALASAYPRRKLTVAQVRELRQLNKEGWSIRMLCRKYGLAVSTVSYIINRKTYYDV